MDLEWIYPFNSLRITFQLPWKDWASKMQVSFLVIVPIERSLKTDLKRSENPKSPCVAFTSEIINQVVDWMVWGAESWNNAPPPDIYFLMPGIPGICEQISFVPE